MSVVREDDLVVTSPTRAMHFLTNYHAPDFMLRWAAPIRPSEARRPVMPSRRSSPTRGKFAGIPVIV
jgi:hypothetical protein